MNSIVGNVTAEIKTKQEIGKDRMGKPLYDLITRYAPVGILDMMQGSSSYQTYDAKIQESTHVFMCDYFEMDIKTSEAVMVIGNQMYDIKYIDDVMGLHDHYEFYLAFVG